MALICYNAMLLWRKFLIIQKIFSKFQKKWFLEKILEKNFNQGFSVDEQIDESQQPQIQQRV